MLSACIALPAGLLAVEAIVRESARCSTARIACSARTIGLGDRRFVGLERDRKIAPVQALDDFGGGARRIECRLQVLPDAMQRVSLFHSSVRTMAAADCRSSSRAAGDTGRGEHHAAAFQIEVAVL